MSDKASPASPSGQPAASVPAAPATPTTTAPRPTTAASASAPAAADAAPLGQPHGFAGSTSQRTGRTISDSTRALFAKAAEAQRARIAASDGGNLDMAGGDGDPAPPRPSVEHDDAGTAPARPAAAAGSAPTAPSAAPRGDQPAAPASPPPAPALDPALLAHQERLNLRAAELDRREAEHAAKLAAAPDVSQYRERYHENPAATLKELVKAWTGVTTDDELKAELGDLVTELSVEALGLSVTDPALQTHRETKKALRAVKAHKAELAALKAKQAAEEKAAKERSDEQQAVHVLAAEFPKVAATYPYLAAEDAPETLIWDVLKSEHKATGIVLDWRDAAKRANDYLQQQASAWFAKRKSILAPDQAPSPAPSAKPAPLPEARVVTSPQGDPQGHRRSGEVSTQGTGRWNRDAHRKATMSKYAEALRVKE